MLSDEIWERVAPRRPRGILARSVVGVLAAALLAVWALGSAGLLWPRLGATVVGHERGVAIDVRLTNLGQARVRPASVMHGDGLEVRAVRPRDDYHHLAFEPFVLDAGESREVRLLIGERCKGEPGSLRLVAYGPMGGTEVEVPLAGLDRACA